MAYPEIVAMASIWAVTSIKGPIVTRPLMLKLPPHGAKFVTRLFHRLVFIFSVPRITSLKANSKSMDEKGGQTYTTALL